MQYSKVLLIDDDEDDQELFVLAIKEIAPAVRCTTFDNAAIALAQLQNQKLTAEIIFLDLNMPIMTGQQFLTEIKKRPGLKQIPVIVFSTSSNSGIVEETKALGAKSFITKPHDYQQLVIVLREILE